MGGFNYSILNPKQRNELENIIMHVRTTTHSLGSKKSEEAVNKAIEQYFKDLKQNRQLPNTQKREEPFEPKYTKNIAKNYKSGSIYTQAKTELQ